MGVLKMLGYMSESEALEYGFTHHGSYYGIPLWVTLEEGFMVATKWAPMEILMSLVHRAEGFMQWLVNPHAQPGFYFKLGRHIQEAA